MKFSLKKTDLLLFELLRIAFASNVKSAKLSMVPSADEWKSIYMLAKRQSVLGVVFSGIKKLPEEYRPERKSLLRWSLDAEGTVGMNKLLNQEAARLTRIFDAAGRKNAILKGPANARLYPDPFSRQCGDIDIWVEGGRESVDSLLLDLNLVDKVEKTGAHHHVHLPKNKDGFITEVHYQPVAGVQVGARKLLRFLDEEIRKADLVPEGFYAPSIKFALVMQLSHLQHHFFYRGLGLRQYADYFVLLRNSTEKDRLEAAVFIKSVYMERSCSAVMWLLAEVFGLESDQMLCAPNAARGKRLLKLALEGGNFGRYSQKKKPQNVFMRWFRDRLTAMSWLTFDPINAILTELHYWRLTLALVPERIKRRKIAL